MLRTLFILFFLLQAVPSNRQLMCVLTTILIKPVAYEKISMAMNPYEEGKACGMIVETLMSYSN